jgi:hypothetical protein
MGEAHHSFTGPPCTHGWAHMEAAQQTMTTPQSHPQEPQWDTGFGVSTRVKMRVVVITPLTVTLSLASKPKPPPLPGTLTGTLLWRDTSVMGLIRLSARWKGSDDSSDGWMTFHTCKWRCKPPSTHRLAWCTTSLVTSGLTLMLKSYKDLSLGEVPGAQVWVLTWLIFFSAFPVISSLILPVGCTTVIAMIASKYSFH